MSTLEENKDNAEAQLAPKTVSVKNGSQIGLEVSNLEQPSVIPEQSVNPAGHGESNYTGNQIEVLIDDVNGEGSKTQMN